MPSDKVKYSAFISYRHVAADRKWAKFIMERLELYRTPKYLVRQNYDARIRHLFRDEDEMPASSDLSKEIRDALGKSEFLFVICSPETPSSRWVQEEIRFFIAQGKRHRIIPVLIAGDPDTSYPPDLFTDAPADSGEVRVEPYAADVRPRRDESRKLIERRALIRLAAPILGCTYDELWRRDWEREKKRRRRNALAYISLAAIAVLLGMIWHANNKAKNAELERERSAKLVQLAANALANSDDDAALRYAVLSNNLNSDPSGASSARTELAAVASSLAWTYAIGNSGTEVELVSLSRDGGRLLVAYGDKTGAVYDAGTARLLTKLGPYAGQIRCAQLSPDGLQLLLVIAGDRPKILNATTGAILKTYPSPNFIYSAAYNTDGSVVAALGVRDLNVWDLATGQLSPTIAPGLGNLWDAQPSPDGRQVVISNGPGEPSPNPAAPKPPIPTASVWDVQTGKRLFTLQNSASFDPSIYDLRYSPDGTKIAGDFVGQDNAVGLWDATTGKALDRYEYAQTILSMEFSPDSKQLIVTSAAGNTADIWNISTGKRTQQLLGGIAQVNTAVFGPSGKSAVLGSQDGTTKFYPLGAGASITLPTGESDFENYLQHRVQYSADGKDIVFQAEDYLSVWNAQDNKLQISFRNTNAPTASNNTPSLSVSGDGEKVFLESFDTTGNLQINGELYDLGSRKVIADLPGISSVYDTDQTNLTVNTSGNEVFFLKNSTFHVFDSRTGKITLNISAPDTFAFDTLDRAVFSPDSSRILLTTKEFSIKPKILNLDGSGHAVDLSGAKLNVYNSAAWRPDGNMVAVTNQLVYLFNADNGALIKTLSAPDAIFNDAEFDTSGQFLVTAMSDGSIRVWDIADGTELFSRIGHQGPVLAAAFSPDGTAIVSSGMDRMVHVWSVPYLTMARGPLVAAVCEKLLAGNAVMSRDEMHAAGLPDSQPVLNVCSP